MTERDLFIAALQLDPADRPGLLDRECAGDPALRRRIEVLLAAHAEAQSAFGSGAGTVDYDSAAGAQAAEAASSVIAGRYKLLERIAEGGMGEVWVAEQFQPVKRKVALKLIKPGMDSKSVLARFEAERQALAMMDHPNIAKVLDGGLAENGRPYFVMDYVKGIPITDYCDAARLGIAERLGLFMQVCSAVQHAHQKGIIHRDLKPSNILVAPYDGTPVPKVIDFGLAKALHHSLTERTLHTAHESVLGTPLYMSPEQAQLNNLDVDTRSDIYSLGVLLYELLTGTTPLEKTRFQEAAWDEIRRIIREEEPPRPSTRLTTIDTLPSLAACRQTEPAKLATQLRGELDWIVMKALEKDRGRRYETANSMARDIQRYLTDEPVEARPPSATYRLQKFVRRNKGRVVAAGIVLVAFVLAIAGTTTGMLAARRVQHEAETQRTIAESEKNQKEQARKQAEDERQRADREAKQALAETKVAVQQKDAARAEKLRADAKADEAQLNEKLLKLALIDFKREHAAVLAEKDRAEIHLRRAEGLLYANQIALAQSDWETGDVSGAWKYLDACRADFRGWEHDYLHALFKQNQVLSVTLGRPVMSVAISPDGKRIAGAGGTWNETAKVWDAASGRELLTLSGDRAGVFSVAFSPDGKRIVGSCWDGTLQVWDATSGQRIFATKPHPNAVRDGAWNSLCRTAAFSPDGKRIVSGFKALTVFDAASGREMLSIGEAAMQVKNVAFSRDGRRIVSDSPPKVWDAVTGRELLTLGELGPRAIRFPGVDFSPDGKRIVTGGFDGPVRVWDATTGKITLTLVGHGHQVWSVAFSPERIVSGSHDKTVRVWDAATGQELLALRGHADYVTAVAFSADGKRIVSGSSDGTVKLWDATKRQETPTLESGNSPRGVAFSRDGTRFLGADLGGAAALWDTATGRKMLVFPPNDIVVNGFSISPDGKRIVVGGQNGKIQVWDAETGRIVLKIKGHTRNKRDSSLNVFSVSFSPDEKRIVSGSYDGTVKVWDAADGREIFTLDGHKGAQVWCVAISPDGTRIVSGAIDNTLKLWDATTGRELRTFNGHAAQVTSVAFSPDGKRVVSGSDDKTVKLWDATSGKVLLNLTGHSEGVNAVAFSPDGKRIVSGSSDKSLKLWDAVSGLETLTLRGHNMPVTYVAFSADGKRILSATVDGTVKIWDASRGPETAQ